MEIYVSLGNADIMELFYSSMWKAATIAKKTRWQRRVDASEYGQINKKKKTF